MSNESKNALLGLNVSTASQRLRKMIMWGLIQETGKDICFRCGERIAGLDSFSIEHKEPWQSAPDPKAAFFDLENIAFSCLRCNSAAGGVTGGPAAANKRRLPPEVKQDRRRASDARRRGTAEYRERQRNYQQSRYAVDPIFAEYHRQKNRAYRSRSRSSIG